VENRLKGFVFIAPEVAEVYTQAIPPAVSSKPMLLTWAKDDPKAEFSEHTRWLGLFSNVQTYFIEQVVQTGMHVVVANIPENIRYGRLPYSRSRSLSIQSLVVVARIAR